MRPPPKEAEYTSLSAMASRNGVRFNEAASQRGGIREAIQRAGRGRAVASMRPPPKEAEYSPVLSTTRAAVMELQ